MREFPVLAAKASPLLFRRAILLFVCFDSRGALRMTQVPTPPKRDLSMVYVEAFRHSTIVVRVELWVGQAALSPDAAALEDLESTTGGVVVLWVVVVHVPVPVPASFLRIFYACRAVEGQRVRLLLAKRIRELASGKGILSFTAKKNVLVCVPT